MANNPISPQMADARRGGLIAGIILVSLGVLFLALNFGVWLLAQFDVEFDIWRLWPLVLVVIGVAFYAAIIASWYHREQMRWLAVPGTILLTNGLIFLYTTLSNNWGAWAYLWTLEPLAVAGGLHFAAVLGNLDRGAETGAFVLAAISLVGFVVFGSLLGTGIIRIIAPLGLIALGAMILIVGIFRR